MGYIINSLGVDTGGVLEGLDELVKIVYRREDYTNDNYGYVAVTHGESGSSIGFYPDRTVFWGNVEYTEIEPRHFKLESDIELLGIVTLVALGRSDLLKALPWKPGYGTPEPYWGAT